MRYEEVEADPSLLFWWHRRIEPGYPPIYPTMGSIPVVVFEEGRYLDRVMASGA